MKKLVFILIFIVCAIDAAAQLEVKEGSFKEVHGFVNINAEKMYDDNDKPYAVLKIKTENINDQQRRELLFQGDAATFFEIEYVVGEIWVYISYYATYLKISHPDLSSTEFVFPYDMKPKCGYELTLVNNAAQKGYGKLSVTTTPVEGASIKLNGIEISKSTPYFNEMISAGQHEIAVSKYGFKSVVEKVVVEEGKKLDVVIVLPYAYGNLNITTDPADAEVYVDGKRCARSQAVRVGKHRISVEKSNYHTETRDITVEEDETVSLNVQLHYGKSITITTDKKGDKIFIDGKEKGCSPLTIILPFGKHVITSYRDKKSAYAEIDVMVNGGKERVDLDLKKETLSSFVQNGYKFITVDAASNKYGNLSYGLTLGAVKNYGMFVSFMTSFNYDGYKADLECDENLLVNGYYPDYTGEKSYSSVSAVCGFIMKLSGPVALRAGVGYGFRAKSYKTSSGYWVRNSSESMEGVDVSLGVQCNFRGFVISLDCVSTNFKAYEAKIGIGYGLKNK